MTNLTIVETENIEKIKGELREYHMKTLENLLGDKTEALRFLSAMTYCLQSVPELLNCEKQSVLNAFMKCAELKLYPSSVSGEAYILPYMTKGVKMAQFQLWYQGLLTLLYRAGVSSITSNIIYKNDEFIYEEGLNKTLIHKPNIFSDRGSPIGVYAIAEVNGTKLFHVMNADQMETYKGFSKSKDSSFSPWNKSGADPELWMWRKTCIKQLAKTLPKNESVFDALDRDNQDTDIAKPYIDQARQGLLESFKPTPTPTDVPSLDIPDTPSSPNA